MTNQEIAIQYLETTLRGELFRSKSYEDFVEWLKSEDRKAEDLRNMIHREGLNKQAREIMARYRGHYAGKPDMFRKDKKHVPV